MTVNLWNVAGVPVGPGEAWTLLRHEGLGSPARRMSGVLLPRNHGGVADEDFAGFRTLTLELRTHGTAEECFTRLAELQAACHPSDADVEVQFDLPGWGPRSLFGRVGELTDAWAGQDRRLDVLVPVVCHDPVMYGATLYTANLPPFVATEFATYPENPDPGVYVFGTYPKLYSSGGGGGGVQVTNEGDWPVWPRVVIPGPTTGSANIERLEAVGVGAMQFTADGGLTVPASQTLVIDTHPARRLIRFQSGADRLNTLVDLDSWFQLPPGTTELRLRVSGSTDGTTPSVQWRDGWL